jgi:hypothetical protein
MNRRVAPELFFYTYGVFMRRGRDFYSQIYEKAVDMYQSGLSIKDIALKLNISYSAAYHWVKGLRKPKKGNIVKFLHHFQTNGPQTAAQLEKEFPKYNELFLTASRRGYKLKRYVMDLNLGKHSTWYFLEGQEKELEVKVKSILNKYNQLKKSLSGENERNK